MTVLHQLSPRHRAILLLRDVIGWKAREVAEYLGITESAVNSTLLRARKVLAQSNDNLHHELVGADTIAHFLDRYIQAWEAKDISLLVGLLKEDVVLNMPPLPTWYRGRSFVEAFLIALPFAGQNKDRWRTRPLGSNGQPSIAIYQRDENADSYSFFGVHVLTIDPAGIERIDHFLAGKHIFLDFAIQPPWLKYFDLPDSLKYGI